MYKKIAKKVVLITLLIFMILAGVSAPAVSFKSTSIADAALPWTKVSPKKTAEAPVEDAPGMNVNACPTCFTAKGPELNSIWNLLTAGLDIVFSLIPRILVLFIKWIVILLAKLYQGLMAPASSLSFVSKLNNYTKPGSIVLWIWSISLYYANIMITLFLIWIAISIILEKKEYTNYQNLIKLLTVALLVNFSLVICTMFVDLSNFVAVMFMAGLSASDVSCLYACTIHKVANIFDCKSTRILFSTTISNSLAFMVGLVFVGQILGLIFYVLVRMVYLWFLVGVSPIAFVLSAIPETRDIYKKWLEMFKANLMKLPILAFASYFILNLMIYIANDFMLNPIAKDENMLVSTLGVVFLLFILAQGLLAVAQNVGVDQISKASAMTNSWAKKSWDAVKKPAMSYGKKKLLSSKPMQSLTTTLTGSRVAPLARLGNRFTEQMSREQKSSQAEIDNWKTNLNTGMLEQTIERNKGKLGDKTKFLQAMQALSELESTGDYKDPKGILNNQENMSQTRSLVTNDLYGETSAGKFMKKRYTWMKAGPDLTDPQTAATYRASAQAILPANASEAQIQKEMARLAFTLPYQNEADFNTKMQSELYERATNPEKSKLNNWDTEIKRLFEASRTNTNPQEFLKIFKAFQTTISPAKMRQIFDNYLVPAQRKGFWTKIASMAIVADQINRGVLPPTMSVATALTNVTPAQIQDSTVIIPAFLGITGDPLANPPIPTRPQNSWMADRGQQPSFLKSLRANQFIN